ncbi:MAG: type II secretion system F family protein [Actinomycetota bacterium]
MTAGWLAVALALVLWPARARSEQRLRRLIRLSRLTGLAGPAPRSWPLSRLGGPAVATPRSWPPAPSGRAALLAGGACAALVGVASSIPLGAAAGVAIVTAVYLAGRSMRRRRAHRGDAALGETIRLLVVELEAGATPAAALSAAAHANGSSSRVFAAAAEAAALGGDVADALGALAHRDGSGCASVAHAWRAATATGAPLAAVLSRVDADLDARRCQVRDVGAALAGPRSSALLLAALPAVGLGLGLAMGAHPFAILFGDSAGQWLLCVGVLLDAAGMAWTLRLTTAAERE